MTFPCSFSCSFPPSFLFQNFKFVILKISPRSENAFNKNRIGGKKKWQKSWCLSHSTSYPLAYLMFADIHNNKTKKLSKKVSKSFCQPVATDNCSQLHQWLWPAEARFKSTHPLVSLKNYCCFPKQGRGMRGYLQLDCLLVGWSGYQKWFFHVAS